MRFELTGVYAAVNLIVTYTPTAANPETELNEVFERRRGPLLNISQRRNACSYWITLRTDSKDNGRVGVVSGAWSIRA